MTYAGARGETATQMAKALHFSLPQAELHPVFAALAEQMNAVQTAGHVKLSIANSLWPHKTYPFLDDYLALVKKNYGSTITPVDYEHAEPAARAQINQWGAAQTKGKIKDLLQEPLAPSTRLILANVVNFKGYWERPFQPAETQSAFFYPSPGKYLFVPMMTQTVFCKYGGGQRLQVLELPYAGNELSMLILLPAKGKTVSDVESLLSTENLRLWREHMTENQVEVFLPRFKISWGPCQLKEPLLALGMRDAFGQNTADFSGMDGHPSWLYIAWILHKAVVEVNEEGTEAAVSAMIGMAFGGEPEMPKLFRADHPFLFLIQENATGSILFMGRVTDPTAQ